MYVQRVAVRGFRASGTADIVCSFPGRFSVVIGANNAGKTTVTEALYWAHGDRFPSLTPPTVAALGPASPREIDIACAFEANAAEEGPLGRWLHQQGLTAPRWDRRFERSLGRVRTRAGSATTGAEDLRVIYLPAYRNPLDELARREAQVLIGLLRAEQQAQTGQRSLRSLQKTAEMLLDTLSQHGLVENVRNRVQAQMTALTAGVSPQFAFVGGQAVDDVYLARVLELLLAAIDERAAAQRLEVSGLGYVNLLHIAVTLAAIPNPAPTAGAAAAAAAEPAGLESLGTAQGGEETPTSGAEPGPDSTAESPVGGTASQPTTTDDDVSPEQALREMAAAIDAEAAAEEDDFFPEVFHVTVVIEEPEAHLHPQLQHGLVRYLRDVVRRRPELQVVLTTHAEAAISACDPTELVVMRKHRGLSPAGVLVADLPLPAGDRQRVLRMARLHMDASRSASLFAHRLLIVEGVTESVVVRQFGRAWAGNDAVRRSFVDALTIMPMGTKVGSWPVELLATPGREVVERLAVLRDWDKRDGSIPTDPAWMTGRDPDIVRMFHCSPTLEPEVTTGNEDAVAAALAAAGFAVPDSVDSSSVDALFQTSRATSKKGEFALQLAAALEDQLTGSAVTVPPPIAAALDFLYESEISDASAAAAD